MKNHEKPQAPVIGADGNIFNLVGIAAKSLKRNGYRDEADEMRDRVFKSHSYEEALGIIQEYVEPVEVDHRMEQTM